MCCHYTISQYTYVVYTYLIYDMPNSGSRKPHISSCASSWVRFTVKTRAISSLLQPRPQYSPKILGGMSRLSPYWYAQLFSGRAYSEKSYARKVLPVSPSFSSGVSAYVFAYIPKSVAMVSLFSWSLVRRFTPIVNGSVESVLAI